jgi:uncharacterized RDD family membrane protein YckC
MTDSSGGMKMRAAGFWIRFLALLLDGIFMSLIFWFIHRIGIYTGGLKDSAACTAIYNFFLPFLWSGQTVGKRITGIRIIRYQSDPGERPGAVSLLIRVLIADVASAFSFGVIPLVSLFMVVIRPDKRALHDLAAGTQVVRSDPYYGNGVGNL